MMNLAALVQNQAFATLLSALASETGIAVGKTIEARLLTLESDGTATALVNGVKIALVLAGPEAKQAALQPGATLTLRIDAPDEAGGALRATLVETRPPAATVPAQSQPAPPNGSVPPGSPASSPATAPNGGTAIPVQPPVTGTPANPALTPAGQTPVQLAPPAVLIAGQQGQVAPLPQAESAGPALIITAARPAQPVATQAGTGPAVHQPVPAAPVQQIAPAISPRALAGPMLGQALARQDSLAPLFANLRELANGSVSLVLPRQLMRLVDQILAQAVPAEHRPVTAQALQAAIARSGLFLEAREAEAAAPQQANTGSTAPQTPPQADLKAGLQALRDILRPLLEPATARPAGPAAEPQAPVRAGVPEVRRDNPEPQLPRPAAPRRDGALVPQPIAEPSLAAAEKPVVIAQTLLEQTEAALDRVKLSQFASLPPEGPRLETQQSARWLTEIPLAFQAGTAILPLQIERDPPQRGAPNPEAPIWRMRFALDVEPMGPLQGVVTLQGRAVGVSLWAERDETSQMLRGAVPDLQAALANAQFEDGTVDVHTGHPQARRAAAGQFLDRLS